MKREKRPTIDDGLRNVILSRFFGESYTSNPNVEGAYIGYMDGIVCQLFFYTNMIIIEQVAHEISAVKFANKAMNTLFATRGLRSSTAERINFDNTTCANVIYSKRDVVFHFFYRHQPINQ